MSDIYRGRCLCGAVQFEAKGPPKWVLWCHCESCRRHSGAPANVFVSFENDAVAMTRGAVRKFSSSPGVERGFCDTCGSTLTCASSRLPSETHYYVGVFERAQEMKPTGEIFTGERLPWLRLHEL